MARFLVVGGGISGLVTAWYLSQAGESVQLIESAPGLGGSIGTAREQGYLRELGPNTVMVSKPGFQALVEALGLGETAREANQAANTRYIVKDGRPRPLPMGPGGFIATPLFSPWAKLRLFGEPLIGRAQGEQSIAEFVRRRLGREVLDWAVDPFISGVYAGDPERLSLAAALPRLHALESGHGSLVRGGLAMAKEKRQQRKAAKAVGAPAPKAKTKARLVSFDGGLATLINGLGHALGSSVETGVTATGLTPTAGGWRVQCGAREYEAEQVILSVPAHAAAALVAPLSATAAAQLEAIHYPPVASVALGFRRADIAHPLDGFGALIPRRLGIPTLGVLFSSTLFEERAPQGHVLLTAFLGGARNPGVGAMEPDAIVEQVRADLTPLLGLNGAPDFQAVTMWPRAIPQYELGHLDRLAAIDQALAHHSGLHFRANWRDGISVGDCIQAAEDLALRLTADGPRDEVAPAPAALAG